MVSEITPVTQKRSQDGAATVTHNNVENFLGKYILLGVKPTVCYSFIRSSMPLDSGHLPTPRWVHLITREVKARGRNDDAKSFPIAVK